MLEPSIVVCSKQLICTSINQLGPHNQQLSIINRSQGSLSVPHPVLRSREKTSAPGTPAAMGTPVWVHQSDTSASVVQVMIEKTVEKVPSLNKSKRLAAGRVIQQRHCRLASQCQWQMQWDSFYPLTEQPKQKNRMRNSRRILSISHVM